MNVFCPPDLQQKYASLCEAGQATQNRLEAGLSARRVHEADLTRLERWCTEAEVKVSTEPTIDCATEILEQQYDTYKVSAWLVAIVALCSELGA